MVPRSPHWYLPLVVLVVQIVAETNGVEHTYGAAVGITSPKGDNQKRTINLDQWTSPTDPKPLGIVNVMLFNVGTSNESISVTFSGSVHHFVPGYTYYPGVGFFKLHKKPKTWSDAKYACEWEGAHLVVINSEKEAAVLRELIQQHEDRIEYLHIGVQRTGKGGPFVTIFGRSLEQAGYEKWNSGRPNNLNQEEECCSITRNALLYDTSCSNNFSFLCEK